MNKEINETCEQLHKRLGDMYALTEENKADLIHFHDVVKEATEKVDNDWDAYAAGICIPRQLSGYRTEEEKRRNNRPTLLKGIKDISKRFKFYLETNKETHDTVYPGWKTLCR